MMIFLTRGTIKCIYKTLGLGIRTNVRAGHNASGISTICCTVLALMCVQVGKVLNVLCFFSYLRLLTAVVNPQVANGVSLKVGDARSALLTASGTTTCEQ